MRLKAIVLVLALILIGAVVFIKCGGGSNGTATIIGAIQ